MQDLTSLFPNVITREVDDVCEIHGIKKIEYVCGAHSRVMCSECYRERTTARNNKKINSALKVKRWKDHGAWLTAKSILDDITIREASFESYVAETDLQKYNGNACWKMTDELMKGDKYNVVLRGNAGTGKSHLAMSMLKRLNANNDKKCVFVSMSVLFSAIRSSFNGKGSDTEYTLLEPIKTADFVVLDDLGAEAGSIGKQTSATDFVIRTLYDIANARQGKATIITTNLSQGELIKIYDAKIVSRLMAKTVGHVLEFSGVDRRVK